jgi:type IV pilus assembly protein PilV
MRTPLITPPTLPTRRTQAGATMIELLVSFVIFAFGMLGVAGLQTKALSFNQASLMRSQATALTDDLLDRLRADRAGAMNSRWNTALTTPSASVTVPGTGVVTTDLADWKRQVETLLPDGQASVNVTSGSGVVVVIVSWDDSRGREDRSVFQTTSRL